jgi:prepilin signal peptidase PulO-like enzyme (type II secretory pathway)
MIVLLLGVIGLCLGSFVNALTWRLHEQEAMANKKATPQKKKELHRLSIWSGRSMCPHCRHQLVAKDLLPVLSWLYLHGKCRYCGKPISWQYPVVELLTAVLFVFSYFYWPISLHGSGLLQFFLWLAFLTGFVALAVYDLCWFILPTRIIQPLIVLAAAQVLLLSLTCHGGLEMIVGGLLGVLVIGGTFYALFIISRGAWIGGGDVRLGVLLGLLVGGPLMGILLIFMASLAGTVVALPLMGAHKLRRTSRMPFGPFLLIAGVFTRLFGVAIIHWYKNRVLGG